MLLLEIHISLFLRLLLFEKGFNISCQMHIFQCSTFLLLMCLEILHLWFIDINIYCKVIFNAVVGLRKE